MTVPEIHPYRPADRDAVVELQDLLWAGGPERNAAYLDWKYSENPYLDHRYIALAWQGAKLVGMVGAFGAAWQLPGATPIVIPCLADAVLTPQLRGSDLFPRMVDAVLDWLRRDRVASIVDFGNGRAAMSLMARGWKSIGPWAVAVAERTQPITDDAWWSRDTIVRGARTGLSITASRSVHVPSIAMLAARASHAPRALRHVSDTAYIQWWFANPLARYFFLRVGVDEPRGALAAHHALDSYDAVTPTTIVDCEAESDALWLDLVEIAGRHLPGRSVRLWLRDRSPGRRDAIGDAGFMVVAPSGRPTRDHELPNMILRATGAPPSLDLDLTSPDAWDLRGICGRSWR